MKYKQSFDVSHAHQGISRAVSLAVAMTGILFVKSRILALKVKRKKMSLKDYKHIPINAHYRLAKEAAVAVVAIGAYLVFLDGALTGNIDVRAGQESKLAQIAQASGS